MFASRSNGECVVRAPLSVRRPATFRNLFALVVIVVGLLGIGSSSSHAAEFGVRSPIPAYYAGYYPYPGFRHSGYGRYYGWHRPYRYPFYYDSFLGNYDFYPSPVWYFPW